MDNKATENQAGSFKFNLMDYWSVILKRKGTVLSFAIPVLVIAAILSFALKPTYTAKGTLLIEKEPNILSFEKILQGESFNDDYYQTQYKLIQSRTVAGNTIEKLKLYENEEFAGKLKRAYGAADEPNSIFRRKLADAFLKRLDVSPIRQTRMVEVRFKDQNPNFAADTLNALFDSFIAMNIQVKYEMTEQASEFLTAQITRLQTDIADKEQKLQQYGAEKNIVSLSDKETTIVQNLGEFNRALTEAQIDRVKKETYYGMIRGVSPEAIPEAIGNQLIQRLREDYGKLSREYVKMEERFGPEYPEMQRVKTELEGARKSLANELGNMVNAAYSDWLAASRKEKSLEEIFNKQKEAAFQLDSNSILYNSLKIEVENKKSLLEALQKRQNETGVSAELKGLGTSNVRIVDRAEAPLYPSSPKKKLNMVLSLLIGLIGGAGLAFFFEHLDDSIKTFDDVERYTGLPSLGAVPAFSPDGFPGAKSSGREENRDKNKPARKTKAEKNVRRDVALDSWLTRTKRDVDAASKPANREEAAISSWPGENSDTSGESIDLITFISPASVYSESYRTIRSSVLLSFADPGLKCIAVSSPLPQEGKSTTLSNLAVTLSQAGKKVLVVDSDLRKPRQHKIFKLLNVNGLSNYLAGTMDLEGLIKSTSVPNLFLINAGLTPPNPIELLGSEKMTALIGALRKQFDYVLFDTPPLLAVTDGLVLGAKLDGLILVVWAERTSREALKRSKEKLDMAKIKTLGVILNNLLVRKHDYYYRHQYYQYYGDKGEDNSRL